MKKPFEVGERVRVYSHYGPYTGEIIETNVKGNTPFGHTHGLLTVKSDSGKQWFQHPKQCRRLKKKDKPEPREFWAYRLPLENETPFRLSVVKPPIFSECFKVREVLEGEEK